jgi:hypothetical protein
MRNNRLLRVYFKTDDIIQYLDKILTIPSFEELEIGAKFPLMLSPPQKRNTKQWTMLGMTQVTALSLCPQGVLGMLRLSEHQTFVLQQRSQTLRNKPLMWLLQPFAKRMAVARIFVELGNL